MKDLPHGTGRRSASPTVAILGAGISGLCLAIRLKQAGFRDFVVFEKSDGVGGTWRDNTYPGAGCDVPSHLYCFSFEPNPDWSQVYAGQPEILRYLEHCATKYGIRRHIRFRTEIAEARFDASAGGWRLRTRAGEEIFADVLVSGTGQLSRPHVPELPGLDEFAGPRFHSARWNHDLDLRGRRVAVIGNGASAVQFVPRIAPVVDRMLLFQRSANWILPRRNREYRPWEKSLFRRVPLTLRLYRQMLFLRREATFLGFLQGSWLGRQIEKAGRRFLHRHVAEPKLQEALKPRDPAGCKRLLLSDDYYQAVTRLNVDVVTAPIRQVTSDGIVTEDGVRHDVDTLVFATGFQATSFLAPMRIEGLDGRVLNDAWREGAEAYLGVGVAGFPNLFLLYGPNTNLGHNSIIVMIESQVEYVLGCLRELKRSGLRWLDVKPEAMRRFNAFLERRLRDTAWNAGCGSWYKVASGKITNNWCGNAIEYRQRTRRPDFDDFERRAS